MKQYQDSDPLHGNGKAVPKPKQPNPAPSYLGGAPLGRRDSNGTEYAGTTHRNSARRRGEWGTIYGMEKGHTTTSVTIVRTGLRPVEIKRDERKARKLAKAARN